MKRNLGMTVILFAVLIFSFTFTLLNNNLLVYSQKDFQIIRKEINLNTASSWELFPFIIDDTMEAKDLLTYNVDSVYVCVYGFNQVGRNVINEVFKETIDGNVLMLEVDTLKNLIPKMKNI